MKRPRPSYSTDWVIVFICPSLLFLWYSFCGLLHSTLWNNSHHSLIFLLFPWCSDGILSFLFHISYILWNIFILIWPVHTLISHFNLWRRSYLRDLEHHMKLTWIHKWSYPKLTPKLHWEFTAGTSYSGGLLLYQWIA